MFGVRAVGIGVNLITFTIIASLLFSLIGGGIDVEVGENISIKFNQDAVLVDVPYTIKNSGLYDIRNLEVYVVVFVEGHFVSETRNIIENVAAGESYNDTLALEIPIRKVFTYVHNALFSGFNVTYRVEAYGEYAYGFVKARLTGMRNGKMEALVSEPKIGFRVLSYDLYNRTILAEITISMRSKYIEMMDVEITANGDVVANERIILDGSLNTIVVSLPLEVESLDVHLIAYGERYSYPMEVTT